MTVADPSPEELAREAQRGSTPAFGRLVERFQKPIFNFLMLRTRNAEDAEEIAQEAFLRAWRRIGTYDDRWRFSTWLFTIARNTASSHLRARPRPTVPLQDVSAQRAEPSRGLSGTELRRTLWDLADRVLTDEQRDALWLRYAEDLPPLEIARILDRRPSSVRVLLFRARARLAEQAERPTAQPSPRIHILGETR